MTSVTLLKAWNQLKTRGPFAAMVRAWHELRYFLKARTEFSRKQTFDKLDALLDYGYETCGAMIRPIQVRSEIRTLLERVQRLNPRLVMEIGTANGGTLFLFTRVASAQAQLISLDLPGGKFGGGYPVWKNKMYRSFALPGQQIHLVRADSHHTETLDQIKALCRGGRLDFLLIDGDHSEAGVRQDFDMYAPLVRPGGLVAFHDITPHQSDPDNKVSTAWQRLKLEFPGRWEEIMEHPDQKWAGIGIILI